MKMKKKEKLLSLLNEIAGSFVRFEVDPNAMVTVTRTELSDDSRTAKFLVSIFPKNKEREILAMLNKKNSVFKNYLKTKTRMKSAKPLFASSILAAASKLNNAGVVEWYTRIIC